MTLQLRYRTNQGNNRVIFQRAQSTSKKYSSLLEVFFEHDKEEECMVILENLDVLDSPLYRKEVLARSRGHIVGYTSSFIEWYEQYYSTRVIDDMYDEGYRLIAAHVWDNEDEDSGVWDDESNEWIEEPSWFYQTILHFINTSNPYQVRWWSSTTEEVRQQPVSSLGGIDLTDIIVCIAARLKGAGVSLQQDR